MQTRRLPASEIRTCPRCGGTGTVRAHLNVLGGRCFGCAGSGWVRKVAPVDTSVTVMVEWPTGIVQARVSPDARLGVADHGNGEVSYAVPTTNLRGIDIARIDDDTEAARADRNAIRAAAERYGYHAAA